MALQTENQQGVGYWLQKHPARTAFYHDADGLGRAIRQSANLMGGRDWIEFSGGVGFV
jgi:hypothetical protein